MASIVGALPVLFGASVLADRLSIAPLLIGTLLSMSLTADFQKQLPPRVDVRIAGMSR